MRLSRREYVLAAGALGGTAGCGGDGATEQAPTETPTRTATATRSPTRTQPPGYDPESPLAARYDVVEHEETYRETEDGPLRVHGTVPEGTGPFPIVVYVHGGAWQYGSPTYGAESLLARAGIAVAGVEYRLAETATYPAAVRDVVAAIQWLRGNGQAANLDPERVALMGGSAGAHLSALVAAAPDHPAFQPRSFPFDEPVAVDAVLPHYGVYDLARLAGCKRPAMAAFFGEDCDDEAVVAEASPVSHVDGDHPPTQLFHGTADSVLEVAQARLYRDALEAAGVPVEYNELDGVGHGYLPGNSEAKRAVRKRTHRAMVRYLFAEHWEPE